MVGDQAKLCQSFLTFSNGSSLRDWIQDLFVKERDMVEASMSTFCATTLLICAPLELLTGALLAEVTGKGLHLKEA
jgi:hypothetical protein